MKKTAKTLLLILGFVLVAVLSVAGTLAYLQHEDSDINVMTLHNVKIEQVEQEWSEDGKLVEFTQDKPLYPYVGTLGWDDASKAKSNGAYRRFSMENVVDKYVSVKNNGTTSAYVRTIFALEMGSFELSEFEQIGISNNSATGSEFPNMKWKWEYPGVANINGHNYYIMVATYEEALEPRVQTIPSLLQVYLAQNATNNDVNALDGNNNGKYDILVVTQGVQSAGFATPEAALNEGFGEVMTNLPWNGETLWNGKASDTWYEDSKNAGTYEIKTAEELAAFAETVNSGNTFSGKTVTLTADIDLGYQAWTPIGNSSSKFQGTFDGNGHTISNLNVSKPNTSYVGLFGYTTNGLIKNLTVNNATVKGYIGVGVIAGSPFTSDYDNIKLTGKVQVEGFAYVGGLVGRNAYADISNIVIDVDKGSYVKSSSSEETKNYRNYVGGVVGFMGEGKNTISNVTSNIDVYGNIFDVGGITGIAHYGNTLTNVKGTGNVYVTKSEDPIEDLEVGGIAGVWYDLASSPVTFEKCEFTGKIFIDGEDKTSEIGNGGLVNKSYNNSGLTLTIK